MPRYQLGSLSNLWHSGLRLMFIMRPSSLGGGRILRRTLSVRLSVRPVIITERHVTPPSELQWHTMYFSARAEGRISYGHLGRTNSCYSHCMLNKASSRNIWSRYCSPALFMRPSSLGGGRILRRTLSVRLSVCLSVCPSVRPSRYRASRGAT